MKRLSIVVLLALVFASSMVLAQDAPAPTPAAQKPAPQPTLNDIVTAIDRISTRLNAVEQKDATTPENAAKVAETVRKELQTFCEVRGLVLEQVVFTPDGKVNNVSCKLGASASPKTR